MIRHGIVALTLTGCTGFSLGENEPGGDTWTEPPPPGDGEHHVGAIAVEPDEDQLWVVHEENRAGEVRGHLAAINPVWGWATDVLDVTGYDDRRVVFPAADRMLLMAQRDLTETLVLFDTVTRSPIASTTKPTWYWGTRTAPSGRAVVVADNLDPLAPLHVIDLATLRHQVIEHDGDQIEAMWNHHADVLLALSVTDPFGDQPSARLLRYDLAGADLDAPLPAPTVAWQLAGYGWDLLFSFTWIGISPDDHWAVFPLIKHTVGSENGEHVLLVLDQTTGGVTLEPGRGPVGFTRDSQAIVSYGPRADGSDGEDLWLIDPATRIRTTVPMPYDGISYYVMQDSDHVVVTDAWQPDQPMTIYDTVTGERRATATTGLDLFDFVRRPDRGELFLESGGAIYDLVLAEGTALPVPMPGPIGNINVRPLADQVVAANRDRATIYRLAMATRTVQGAPITLPKPFDTDAPALGIAKPSARLELAAGNRRLQTHAAHAGDATVLEQR